jgi:predicted secreted Zn-dependent protease
MRRKHLGQKRTLKNKLRTLKMEKDESVASSFTKISQVRDQLLVIGVTGDDDNLVQTAVDCLPPSWETFLSGVNAHENQPNFERLWHDCLHEEGRIQSRSGPSK